MDRVVHIHGLIIKVVAPVLDQTTPLLNAIYANIQDSESLSENGIEGMVSDVIWDWARQLADPVAALYPTFVAKDMIKVAFNDWPPVDFWRSELGQIVMEVGGFPERPATKVEAAAVLGLSRSAMYLLLRRGELKAEPRMPDRITRTSLIKAHNIRRQIAELSREVTA